MNFKSFTEGWRYINTIFDFLSKVENENNSIFVPHYLFRGINKRFFSRSPIIENYLGYSEKNGFLDDKEKRKVVRKYNELYNKALKEWNTSLNRKENPLEALEAISKVLNGEEIINCPIVPEYIKSGEAVRLQTSYTSNTHHIDYVNYIKHMLNDVKNRFPQYVEGKFSDIEIIADLQHKGAASCLVDFSTNFLISLWFATSAFFEDFGYLFFYDINKATIEGDSLTILDNDKKNSSITDLLYATTKTTKYSGKQTFRFWLWKPSNINTRIARQDSVFLFGLEKFKITDHNIIVVPIPPTWKKPIQHFLKAFFGITSESIYCDIDGYADSNAKLEPYEKVSYNFFKIDANQPSKIQTKGKTYSINNLEIGLDCLLQSEYESALKYLSLFESEFEKIRLKDNYKNEYHFKDNEFLYELELHYSKALCMKHLHDPFGCITECKKTIEIGENALTNLKSDSCIISDYISNKILKARYSLIDLYYDTEQYKEILSELESLSLPEDNEENNLQGNLNLLKFTISKEIKCLYVLRYYIQLYEEEHRNINICIDNIYDRYDIDVNILNNFEKSLENKFKDLELTQPFYTAVYLYFDSIVEVIRNSEVMPDTIQKLISDIKDIVSNEFENEKGLISFYSNWHFEDIEYYLEKVKNIDENKYTILMQLTSIIKDFENYIQGSVHIDPW